MKKNIITLKFSIESDTADTILKKLLSGRFNWSTFFNVHSREIAKNIISFDVVKDKDICVYKPKFRESINKKKVHYYKDRKIICGIDRNHGVKYSKRIFQVTCKACIKSEVYRQALKPVKDFVFILRGIKN